MDSKNKSLNKSNTTKSKSIDKIINEYIKKICDFDNLNKTFEEKLSKILLAVSMVFMASAALCSRPKNFKSTSFKA